jgi:hypothetical protein
MHSVSFLASALAVLLGTGRLPAQPVPEECSGEELVILEAVLEDHLSLFTSEESADFRQRNNLMQLPPDVDREVITDKKTCKSVVRKALDALNTQITPGSNTKSKAVQTPVFRYGPYYVVRIEPPTPPPEVDLAIEGWVEVIILSVDTLEFLGWILG